ncbi:hypothetical protein [Aliiroseovarius sp.]|uniref:hypothetical protein n=1 Tax=Aliiroseovarius sp. TaxID=1872442 RepID=UPI003BAD6938
MQVVTVVWQVLLLVFAAYGIGFVLLAVRAHLAAERILVGRLATALQRAFRYMEPNEVCVFSTRDTGIQLHFHKYRVAREDGESSEGVDWIILMQRAEWNAGSAIAQVCMKWGIEVKSLPVTPNMTAWFLDLGAEPQRYQNGVSDILASHFGLNDSSVLKAHDRDLITPNKTYERLRARARQRTVFQNLRFDQEHLFEPGHGLLSLRRPAPVQIPPGASK